MIAASLLAACATAPTTDNGPHLKRVPGAAQDKLVCFDASGAEVPTSQCPPVPYNYYTSTNFNGALVESCEDGKGHPIALSHCKAICVDEGGVRKSPECKSVAPEAYAERPNQVDTESALPK